MESIRGATQTHKRLEFFADLLLGRLKRADDSDEENKACPKTEDERAYVGVLCEIGRLEDLLQCEKQAAADPAVSTETAWEKVKQDPLVYANEIWNRVNRGLLPVLHGLTVKRSIARNLETEIDRLKEYYGRLDSGINKTFQFTRERKDGEYKVKERDTAQKYYEEYQKCMHLYRVCLDYLETEMLGKLKDFLGDIGSRL